MVDKDHAWLLNAQLWYYQPMNLSHQSCLKCGRNIVLTYMTKVASCLKQTLIVKGVLENDIEITSWTLSGSCHNSVMVKKNVNIN